MAKPAIPVPGGNVTVEVPDGVTKTYGDNSRNSLYNAKWVGDGRGYGAFPAEERGEGVMPMPWDDEDTDRIDPLTGGRQGY
ncbi:MAG: hypothetical protein AB7J28_15395 [Hyphomonadaceae bacterium]